jgi:hypothetical protein
MVVTQDAAKHIPTVDRPASRLTCEGQRAAVWAVPWHV